MRRYFNTEGACRPQEHYMVALDQRLEQIKTMLVDRKKYFVINKGRQYGKTTTLRALAKYLQMDYFVFLLDFQRIGTEDFAAAPVFARAFAEIMIERAGIMGSDSEEQLAEPLSQLIKGSDDVSLKELFTQLSRMCASPLL